MPDTPSYTPDHFACWFEIPVTDLNASVAFYGDVFQMDLSIDTTGPHPMVVFPTADPASGVSGHLYGGKPSSDGPTIHLVVPDSLAETRKRVEAAGGTVMSPDIEIPPGTFCYAKDPDGNSIGLFQVRA